jgi:hypothetical protein
MQIVRHPWTSDLTETLVSRIFEYHLKQKYPTLEIDHIGRDFPVFGESNYSRAGDSLKYFTGTLPENPIRFLELQPETHALIGIQISQNSNTAREKMGMKDLFLSETFRREFSSHQISTRDSVTNQFLIEHGIESTNMGCVSFLLSSLNLDLDVAHESIETLLIDIDDKVTVTMLTKMCSDELFKVVTTRVPEIYGEIKKNSLIDSLINTLCHSKVVVTSNMNIAVPALSLGKKVILITDSVQESTPFSKFMRVVDRRELFQELKQLNLRDLATRMPPEEIFSRQGTIEEFVYKALHVNKRQRRTTETSDYRNHVVSEVVSALLAKVELLEAGESQFRTLLESRSWKATAPLRRATGLQRRLKGR